MMNRKVLYVFAAYFSLVFIGIASCSDCGGPTTFQATPTSAELAEFTSTGTSEPTITFEELDTDTLWFGRLAIELEFDVVYSAQNSFIKPYNLIQSAYACDPAPPTTQARLDDIRITSETPFDASHPAGSNLADLFDVIVDSESVFGERYTLEDYLRTMPSGPYRLALVLTEPPSDTASFSFDIDYFQSGLEEDIFSLTTNSVVITP